MANETQHVSDHGKDRSKGREDNAARPLGASGGSPTPAPYPETRRDDSIESPGERRSFDPAVNAPAQRRGAGDASEIDEGLLGPKGDPAEGKR